MTVKKNTPEGRDRGSKVALPAYVGRASLRCPGIHTVQGQLFILCSMSRALGVSLCNLSNNRGPVSPWA